MQLELSQAQVGTDTVHSVSVLAGLHAIVALPGLQLLCPPPVSALFDTQTYQVTSVTNFMPFLPLQPLDSAFVLWSVVCHNTG